MSKFPFIEAVYSRTGLAAMDQFQDADINTFSGKNILPPSPELMCELDDQRLREYFVAYSSVLLHNILNAASFPKDARLKKLLKAGEKKLVENQINPWVRMFYESGVNGKPINPNELAVKYGASEQIQLQITRPTWDVIGPRFINDLAEWALDNKNRIYDWTKLVA